MENSGPSILGNNKMATDPIKAKQSNIIKFQEKIKNLVKSAEDLLKEVVINVAK
jgi:hypothetical protein